MPIYSADEVNDIRNLIEYDILVVSVSRSE